MKNLLKNKKFYVATGIVLMMVVVVFFTYKLNKSNKDDQVEVAAETIQKSANDERVAVTPTIVVVAETTPTPSVVENEAPDPVFVADASEVINSKPVTTDKEDQVADDKDITPTPVAKKKVDTQSTDKKSSGNSDQSKSTSDSKKTTSKSSKKEVKVIDESKDTIKDETVKEYKGGEKTGSGKSLKDIPGWTDNKEPEGKAEKIDDKINDSKPVGTWN
jgi:hypothetical protein